MNAHQAAALCSLAQEYNDALDEAEAAKAEAEEAERELEEAEEELAHRRQQSSKLILAAPKEPTYNNDDRTIGEVIDGLPTAFKVGFGIGTALGICYLIKKCFDD